MIDRSWSHDLLHHTLFALLHRFPTLAMRAIPPVAGRLRQRVWPLVTTEQIAAAMGARPERELRRIADEVAITRYRNHAIEVLIERRGYAAVFPMFRLVRREHFTALRARGRPVILVVTHVGAFSAVTAMLAKVGETALVLRMYPRAHLPPGFESSTTHDLGAQALKRAVDRVRGGGVVAMALEGAASSVMVPMLGKQLAVARGPLVLSRLTGAAIVPITMLWRSHDVIEVDLHAPIERPAGPADVVESALARQLARFVETATRAHPGQLQVERLIELASAPVLEHLPA